MQEFSASRATKGRATEVTDDRGICGGEGVGGVFGSLGVWVVGSLGGWEFRSLGVWTIGVAAHSSFFLPPSISSAT